MDDTTLTSLRATGAMIGDSNRESWDELLEKHGPAKVRFAIANAKRSFDVRQVTATQVAKELGHKLKCHEQTKPTTPAPAAAPVKAEEPEPTEAEADEEADDQVDETTAPAEPAPPRRAYVRVDWAKTASELGVFTARTIAAKSGGTPSAATAGVRKLLADGLVEALDPGSRYTPFRWLGDRPTPEAPIDLDPALVRASELETASLREVFEKVIDEFVKRRGYAETRLALTKCSDLVQ